MFFFFNYSEKWRREYGSHIICLIHFPIFILTMTFLLQLMHYIPEVTSVEAVDEDVARAELEQQKFEREIKK